jgi:hypothetical protein
MGTEIAKLSALSIKGDFDATQTKVVHMRRNPAQAAARAKLVAEVRAQLRSEGVGGGGAEGAEARGEGGSAEELVQLRAKLASAELSRDRLKEVRLKEVAGVRGIQCMRGMLMPVGACFGCGAC